MPLESRSTEVYNFFSFLGAYNGILVEFNNDAFVGSFPRISNECIQMRRLPSSDLNVFKQIFHWEEYLPVVEGYKIQFPGWRDHKIRIIDAGSNIGLTSLFFLKHFENSQIACVEPDQDNFKILNFNTSQFSTQKVQKFNAALWSEDTRVEIINDFRDRSDWAKRVSKADEGSIEAFSLNRLVEKLKWKSIDILKIDIEGAEKEIFLNKRSNLSFLNITKCLAIEIHDEFDCRSEIYEKLREYKFTFFNAGELTIGYKKF